MIWSETDLKVSSELSKIMDFSRLSGGLYKTNGNYAIPENAKIKALFNNSKIQLSELKSTNIGLLENSDNSGQLSSFTSLMNLGPLYDQNDFGNDVVVAVVDTGVDPNHPAMTGKIFATQSFVTTLLGYPNNENPVDTIGHGTAVSSVIAGSYLNYNGIAPETKIVGAKIGGLTDEGKVIITSIGLLAAIDWILTIDEVDIINFSLGEPEEGPELDVLEIAVNEAVKMGKIVISSAGNAAVSGLSSYEPFSLSSPGTAPEAISIGSISFGGTISSFSSEGPSMNWEAKPDFVAPGQSIRIAKIMNNYNCGVESSESCFSSLSGTSFSTPVVAGAVSLLVSSLKRQNITYTPGTVKAAMHITADSLGIYWSDQGSGLPNVGNATALIQANQNLITSIPNSLPYLNNDQVPAGSELTIPVSLISSSLENWSIKSITGNGSQYTDIEKRYASDGYTTIRAIKFHPVATVIPGDYQIEVTFKSIQSGELHIEFSVEVLEMASNRILMDLTHTYWDSLESNGQRLERFYGRDTFGLINIFRDNGFWVDELLSGELTTEVLADYEAVWIPSAFTSTNPLAWDHAIPRLTDLKQSEFYALLDFKERGGNILLDFGGTSILDSTFEFTKPNEESLKLFLALLGIVGDSYGIDQSLNDSVSPGNSGIVSANLDLESGRTGLTYGIPLLTSGNKVTAVATLDGSGSKVVVINYRNWRDQFGISRAENIQFATEIIQWLGSDDGFTRIDFGESISHITIIGELDLSESINENEFLVAIQSDNLTVNIVSKSISSSGSFVIEIMKDSVGSEIQVDLEYQNHTISISKYMDFTDPVFTLIARPGLSSLSPDHDLQWQFKVDDDLMTNSLRVQIEIFGSGVETNQFFDDGILTIIVPSSEWVSDFNGEAFDAVISLEIIDKYGNHGTLNQVYRIDETTSSTSSKTSISPSSSSMIVDTTESPSRSNETPFMFMNAMLIMLPVLLTLPRRMRT